MLRVLPFVACLGLGSMPMGGCLRTKPHAACPWGAALASLAACPGLGSVPIGSYLGLGCMPIGATLTLAVCLALVACLYGWPWPWLLLAHMFGVIFLNMRHFWKKEVIFPKDATVGILEGMPTCTQRHIAPYRLTSSRTPEKLTRAFLHFCVPKFIP